MTHKTPKSPEMANNRITEREALLRLSTLCSQAEHCAHEMTEKMQRWELTEEEQARVMERLTKDKFIDDERFARVFALDKIRYNKWGRRKVEQALWLKRIDADIRRRVLDGIDEEEYMAVLRPLLKSKRRSTRAADSREMTMKLMRFAMGRGFGMDEIKACLDCDDDLTDGCCGTDDDGV